MKKSTNGSASPSLSPDSRFSAWRTEAGTRCEVTTAEVTTGSVAERTAPSRKASAQLSSENNNFAASARKASVSGIAITSARTTGPQWTTSSSRSTKRPSENRVTISARRKRWTTALSEPSMWMAPASARISPEATERTAIERTVPRISPDRAAASANRAPLIRSASPKPTSMGGLYSHRRRRSWIAG